MLNQVTYAFNESDLRVLMHILHKLLQPGRTLIVTFSEIGFSFLSFTRGNLVRLYTSIVSFLLTSRRKTLSRNGEETLNQGWGYHRSKKEMIDISKAMGFEVLNFSRFRSESYLILDEAIQS